MQVSKTRYFYYFINTHHMAIQRIFFFSFLLVLGCAMLFGKQHFGLMSMAFASPRNATAAVNATDAKAAILANASSAGPMVPANATLPFHNATTPISAPVSVVPPAHPVTFNATKATGNGTKQVKNATAIHGTNSTTGQAVAAFNSTIPANATSAANGTKPTARAFANATVEQGWVQIEPGMRPAYVGIHGGTAPLSVVRASNGTLFAVTGQTGNDFMHVLKRNNASLAGSSSAQNNKAEAPAEAAKRPQATHANGTITEQTPQMVHPVVNNASTPADAAAVLHATKPTVNNSSATGGAPVSLGSNATAQKTVGAGDVAAASTSIASKPVGTNAHTNATVATQKNKGVSTSSQSTKASSVLNATALPKATAAEKKETKSPAKARATASKQPEKAIPQGNTNATDDAMNIPFLPKAETAQTVIMATGGLANKVTSESGGDFLPFGLTQPENLALDPLPAPQKAFSKPKTRPLKLGSYKELLNE